MNDMTSGRNTSAEFNPDNPSVMFEEYVEIFRDAENEDDVGGNADTSRWEVSLIRDSTREYTMQTSEQ